MAKGAEKSSPCMLSRHVVHLGILKWTRMRESSPSILKLDKSLSHLRNLRVNLNITLVLLLPGSSRDFIIGHKELKELLLIYINL
jgi:hypothetical protein